MAGSGSCPFVVLSSLNPVFNGCLLCLCKADREMAEAKARWNLNPCVLPSTLPCTWLFQSWLNEVDGDPRKVLCKPNWHRWKLSCDLIDPGFGECKTALQVACAMILSFRLEVAANATGQVGTWKVQDLEDKIFCSWIIRLRGIQDD